MATVSSPSGGSQTIDPKAANPRFSRLQGLAVVFLLIGLLLFVIARVRIDPAQTSSLGFEKLGQRNVLTQMTVTILAALAMLAALGALV